MYTRVRRVPPTEAGRTALGGQGVTVPHFHAAIAPERWCQCSAEMLCFCCSKMH